ncbi:sialate O-acetylesterase [Marinilongibacter aquaticus]|uniref:sialate O-acetylesterase n=1 Tax=Marinilongibacter aquaticus TaxID=2975157 RepID=UPI0021BD7812|nr:sialate O-acetylesterase [Marinilongibacter aquaticus]UBM57768.1 sialate O-acetylesterase [Marinilongibacter aquaticus]
MRNILTLLFLSLSFIAHSQINISWPIDRAVFQRDNNGLATVWFAGQRTSSWASGYSLQYKIVKMDKLGTETTNLVNWTNITLYTGKTFRFSRSTPNGWYKFYVRTMDGSTQLDITSVKFGVGEVFVIAGQSNALGEGVVSYGPITHYDCVVASNQTNSNKCSLTMPVFPVLGVVSGGNQIGPNAYQGWAYELLGNKIVDNTPAPTGSAVPVMFFNTAMSGSSVDQWNSSINNTSGYYDIDPYGVDRCTMGNNGQGEPYRTLRNSLNYYSSLFGIRAVIWHQGEADNHINMNSSDYATKLGNLVSATRLNYNTNLKWAISSASWDGSTTDINITNGQSSARTNTSSVLGAASDSYTSATDRQYPGYTGDGYSVHFNYSGLQKVSDQYLSTYTSLLSTAPVVSADLPSLTITSTSITAQSGYSCYQWVQNNATYTNNTYPNGCTASNATLNVNSGNNGTWRCYMKEGNGNVRVSQAVTISSGTFPGGLRVGLEQDLTVYPNPTSYEFSNNMEFTLERDAHVKLEIVDENGFSLKGIANNYHTAGTYKYPFSPAGFAKYSENNIVYTKLTIDGVSTTKRIVLP